MQNEIANIRDFRIDEDSFDKVIAEVEDYAIFLLDKEGNVLTWNKGAEKIKGYKASEIIGKSFRLFYSKADKDAELPDAIIEEARANGRVVHEGWRIRKDGTRFWGSVTLTAIHNTSGEVTRFLKVTRDLTERKMTDDRYSNLIEEFRQKNDDLKRSEERYHRMVAEIRDYAIILLDIDGRILDWNKGAEKLKGYSSAEIIGKNFRMFYPKEDKAAGLPERLLKEAVEQGSINHEGWRVRKDGSRFWGSISITTLHSKEGQVIGFSKVTRDLTERKIAEDQLSNYAETLRQKNEMLQQSEERYHKMIAEVEDYAIILLDREGNILNWNAGAQHIKGYVSHEVLGKSFKLFYTKEDRESGLPDKLLSEAMRKGKANHEGWRVTKEGKKFWGSVVITALHNDDNDVIGFSKVTRDLTEKKHAEEALLESAGRLDQQNKELARLNEEISSFAFIASHDLKEPLRKIQTFADLLNETESLSARGKQNVERIQQGASRMKSLMEDLLSYSQITFDHSHFETINLNNILRDVISDLEILIKEKTARIDVSPLPEVRGLPFQFHQLFLNLISNALKFSKEGILPVISITADVVDASSVPIPVMRDGLYHHITVADNGIGFEPQYAQKIFDIFHRLNTKGTFSGTGIGLSIVKKVIENHGGVIVAEGKPDVGATFNIYLPVPS